MRAYFDAYMKLLYPSCLVRYIGSDYLVYKVTYDIKESEMSALFFGNVNRVQYQVLNSFIFIMNFICHPLYSTITR